MTRRLGSEGNTRPVTTPSTLSLVAFLAWGGGVMIGCGGGSNASFSDSGTPVTADGGVDSASNHDAGPADTGTADTSTSDGTTGECPAPTFSPSTGTADPGTVAITDTSLPAGGHIYFTTDGTNPTQSSTVYSGPIQVTQNTTFLAAALAPSCTESAVVAASYTVMQSDGGPEAPVTFTPPSETQPNDFLVTLSAGAGATICYTLDGSTPTCTNGTCTGTASTYSSTSRVPIDGSVTNAATGQVTVTAIACEAGFSNTASLSQIYTLQADPPTLTGLAQGAQSYDASFFQPTIQSLTVASVTPVNTPVIRYTTDGTTPSCTVGSTTANPTTFNGGGASPTLAQKNGQLQGVTCKSGYLPSTLATWTYTFTLTAPTITGGTFFAQPTVVTGTTPAAGNVVDGVDNAGADVLCATTDGTAPTCAAAGGCATTDASEVAVTAATGPRPGNNGSANTTIEVVACPTAGALPISGSTVASATFTLQLPQPFLSTGDPDTIGPGWDSTTDGLPVTGFNIPNSYVSATPYPYGDTCGASPCVLNVAEVQGPGASCPQAGGAGCTKEETADYYCWSLSGAAACGCAAANQVATGNGGFNGEVSKALPAGAGVTVGKTLSLIACQNAGAAIVWGASAPTGVVVSAAGHATSPALSAPTSTPYLGQATATITNQDTQPSAVCWTYAASALTPTCSAAGACNTTCPNNATCGGLKLGGKNDSPADNVYTFLPGSSDGTGAAATTYTSGANKSSATNVPGLLQANGFVLSAIACNASEQASSPASQAYAFAMAPPHVSSLAAYIAGQYGDLDTATTVGGGQIVYLTTTSNYDIAGALPKPNVSYATGASASCGGADVALQSVTFANGTTLVDLWDNGKTPPGQTPNPVTVPTVGSTWELSLLACGQTATDQPSSAVETITYALAAATPLVTTSQDVPVASGLNQESTLCTVGGACGTAGNKPCCTCSTTKATCGTSGHLPCCCSVEATAQGGASASCTPEPTWENAFTTYISSPTPGASLCLSTVAPPTCNAGVCGGAVNQASPVTLAVGNSPTTVYALGCAQNLPPSQPVVFTFDIKTTGATLVTSGAGSCAPNPYIELDTDPAHGNTPSVADISLGGPSASTCLCYTVDGTPPKSACNAAACTAHPAGTTATCFRAYTGGTYAENQLTLSSTTTVSWATCSTGLDPSTGAPVFSTQPYEEAINVDGALGEWDQSTWGTATQTDNDDTNVVYTDEYQHTVHDDLAADGMFTYDASNLYFAFAPKTSAGSTNTTGMCCNASGATCQLGTCYPAAASTLAIYIGTGVTGGATTDLPLLDPGLREATRALPAAAGIRYAFTWQTGSSTAPAAWVWTPGTPGSWGPGTFTTKVGYNASTGNVEFGVAQSALGLTATSSVNALGTIVGDTGASGLPATGSSSVVAWPDGAWSVGRTTDECADSYGSYWSVNLASCSTPASQMTLGAACL